MKWPTFTELVGALMGLGATAAVIYVGVVRGVDPPGALVAIAAAGVGFFLRAKVLDPTAPPVVITPAESLRDAPPPPPRGVGMSSGIKDGGPGRSPNPVP